MAVVVEQTHALDQAIRRALREIEPEILIDVPSWYLDSNKLAQVLVDQGWRLS